MKSILPWVILFLAGLTAAYFIGRSNGSTTILPDNSKEIAALKDSIRESESKVKSLNAEIAELQAQKEKSKETIKDDLAEIDVAIEIDSANAIVKYRDNLFLLNYMPDQSDYLTFREIGLGSKLFVELRGSRIQLTINDTLIARYKAVVKEKDKQIENKEILLHYSSQTAEYYEDLYKETQGFFYDRFIVYAGIGMGYDGTNVRPELQIGVGIKIVGNK